MKVVEPAAARSRIEYTAEGLRITIPARKNWLHLIFFTPWLVGWAVAEVSMIVWVGVNLARLVTQRGAAGVRGAPEDVGVLALVLLFWTLGGGVALVYWLWMVAGREMIEVDSEAVTRSWLPLRFPRTRRYAVSEVLNLRTVERPTPWWAAKWPAPPWYQGRGAVAFDYGGRTVYFGSEVEEAEGRHIMQAVVARFPKLGKTKEGEGEQRW